MATVRRSTLLLFFIFSSLLSLGQANTPWPVDPVVTTQTSTTTSISSTKRIRRTEDLSTTRDDYYKIPLPFGDVNILVLTDVHSWIAGHERHEANSNVDYGDVLSFFKGLKNYVKYHQIGDVFLVMNGDFMDGTGLSTIPPKYLTPLLETMPFDIINLGNHELYHDEAIRWISREFIPKWHGHYLTSNALMKSTGLPIGNRYTYLHGSNSTLLVFGFLYNFEGNCDTTVVEKVEDVVRQEWFPRVLRDIEKYDAILVMAHMHVTDPLVYLILKAMRTILPADVAATMPIQFITGHTHIRAHAVLDDYATSMEAGRFLDTIGFVSFPTHRRILHEQKHAKQSNNKTTEELFPHVFLDANRQFLSKLLDTDPLETVSGARLTDRIHQTQYSLGLLEPVGCDVPQSYHLNAGLDLPQSLWGLYMREIVPTLLTHHNELVVFVQGTGAFRYSLFRGTVVVDDVIAVCPFNDTIYQITTNLMGWQLLEVLNITGNNTQPNTVIRRDQGTTELPYFAVSTQTIRIEESYTLLTSNFHRSDLVDRVEQLMGLPIPDPQPVKHPSSGGFWTTTNLWMEFVKQTWPCEEPPSPPPVPSLALGVPNTVEKEERPIVATLFIVFGIWGFWIYMKRKQQLQRLDYMPIGDPATNLIRSSSRQQLMMI